VAEAARKHGVNESLSHTWKAQFLEAGRVRLAGDRTDDRPGKLERENERLKALVSEKELALHIAKKLGISAPAQLLVLYEPLLRDQPQLSLARFACEAGVPAWTRRDARQQIIR